jgi:hypothetical protein
MIAPDECPPNSLGARSTWGEGTRPPSPAVPTGNAPRHAVCSNLGRRVALNEVGVMPGGEGSREVPLGWASHWRFVLAARHGWRAVLRLLGPPSARSGCEAPRWIFGEDCRVAWIGAASKSPPAARKRPRAKRTQPSDCRRQPRVRMELGACSSQLPGASREQSWEPSLPLRCSIRRRTIRGESRTAPRQGAATGCRARWAGVFRFLPRSIPSPALRPT